MQVKSGDRLVIHSKTVGAPDEHGEVTEVRGDDGGPPYLVKFDNGHERLIFPGPDCEVQSA
ncbi:MAG: DUF1918 domain-containing protein [Nocardioidaceae bacterium]